MLKSRRPNIISNSKEEALKFKISKDNELTDIIASCIANNEFYSVKNKKKIIKAIFVLVRVNIQEESLVLTLNIIRFLALRILKNDLGLIR